MDTETTQNETSTKIAVLNDAARTNAANYVATRGIVSLEPEVISDIFIGVQEFSDFTEDNDPYGEHDFGALSVAGHRVFWKIDYYDQELKHGLDPLDPKCRRVLTIMLAKEY